MSIASRHSAVETASRRIPRIGRRDTFRLAAVIAASLTAQGCADPPTTIRLGAALPGGQFHQFASALAAAADAHTDLRIEPVAGAGSVENLELLARNGIETALVLGDSIPVDTRALAIGRVHECYIQVAVRPGSPIRRLSDLRGGRIDLGLIGSGSAGTGLRLLHVAGLRPGVDIAVEHRRLQAAGSALQRGEVDAILWGDEVPTPVFDPPLRLRVLDLAEWVAPLRDRFGYPYDRVSVPGNAYPGSPAVDTVGVPTLLLADPGLSGHTVTALACLLLTHGEQLVPHRAMTFQFLERRWLVGTGRVPLHPSAAAYYRAGHG